MFFKRLHEFGDSGSGVGHYWQESTGRNGGCAGVTEASIAAL
ncbi:hypothetical protein [Shewanella sp. GXUN23E]